MSIPFPESLFMDLTYMSPASRILQRPALQLLKVTTHTHLSQATLLIWLKACMYTAVCRLGCT